MQLSAADKLTVSARLSEAKQSLDEVIGLLDTEADASALISKLNESSRRLDRASFALMVSSLQGTAEASEPERAANIKHLEQLFLDIE